MSWWSSHRAVDPADIEARFSNEDALEALEHTTDDILGEVDTAKIEHVRGLLDLLPAREADFMELYFLRHIKQTEIARIFGVSQPTVCYRLQRATARIKFLLEIPKFSPDEIRTAASAVLTDPVDVEILALMYVSTCQSEAAKHLGVSQGFVRHRFFRSLNRLRKEGQYGDLVTALDMISKNLNILREVKRPHWESRTLRVLA